MKCNWLLGLLFLGVFSAEAQHPVLPVEWKEGKFNYMELEKGDRIPDYSYCGYELSEKKIPLVPNKLFIRHTGGDATRLIQSAIDYVSEMRPDAEGFRGAVLLDKGTFEIAGELYIRTSGVILRGSGAGENGTTLLATGNARETVVSVLGKNDLQPMDTVRITDEYVPLNGGELTLSSVAGLKEGDRIQVRRIGAPQWIEKLGTGGDRPGNLDLHFDRTIKSIKGNQITLDIPLMSSIAQEDGGGEVIPYKWEKRIRQVGVEFLNIVSRYDESNPKDEEHAWWGISMQDVENGWVRQVHFKHLGGSAVILGDRASKITVEECIAREPVSEIGGGRRYVFYTLGQQTLFQNCYSEYGYHDFIVGRLAAGPNAFVGCRAEEPHSFSGALENWSVGTLFDIVYINGHELGIRNRENDGNQAGWTGANNLFWNCQASVLLNYLPPTAYNWAFGCWAQFKGEKVFHENSHISPRSFFYAQLSERMGRDMSIQGRIMPTGGESSSSPSIEVARKLTLEAYKPALTLYDWIRSAEVPEGALISQNIPDQSVLRRYSPEMAYPSFEMKNGWLVWNDAVLTGKTQSVRWWSGSDKPIGLKQAGAHITRYVPGRIGEGLTDDLDEMTDNMVKDGVAVTNFMYALWYDRRRDDHERFRRMDGEVWTPLYELPFARSGQGRAWDGLSKYDLTRFNNWYFRRLAEYAHLGSQKGLVLINQHYHQHNIIEAGAHYADFPWRPANNVNNTPFVEPVNYAGDKRIFYDAQFYDVTNPEYAALHKGYIRHQLDNFPEHTGVIHSTSDEYTGPFEFVKFWLETVGEWERETGKKALIALSTTKDVQDMVLADPALSPIVDVIDIRYWSEGEEGINAPAGGVHLAPRQHLRIKSGGKSGKVTERSVYNAVRRYRDANPEKAVLYNSVSYPQFAWSVFMAGGSLAGIPIMQESGFLQAVSEMNPSGESEDYFLLSSKKGGAVYYPLVNVVVSMPLVSGKKYCDVIRMNARTGKVTGRNRVRSSSEIQLKRGEVVWIR